MKGMISMKRVVLIISTIVCIFMIYEKVGAEEIIIPDAAIRLRVIPNSNDSYDIVMKEKVKDYLEANVYDIVVDSKNVDEARVKVQDKLDDINKEINNIFDSNNYDVDFTVNYGKNYFPAKKYKGITYKEGEYESLVVSIGKAEGDNFWCVLFPTFCLLDSKEQTEAEYKFFVKELVDKYF